MLTPNNALFITMQAAVPQDTRTRKALERLVNSKVKPAQKGIERKVRVAIQGKIITVNNTKVMVKDFSEVIIDDNYEYMTVLTPNGAIVAKPTISTVYMLYFRL